MRRLLSLLLLPALAACTHPSADATPRFDGQAVADAAQAVLDHGTIDTTVHVRVRALGHEVTFIEDGHHDLASGRSEGTIHDVTGGGHIGAEVLEGLHVRTIDGRTELRHRSWGDRWIPTPSPPPGAYNVPTVLGNAAAATEVVELEDGHLRVRVEGPDRLDVWLDDHGRLRRVRQVIIDDDLRCVLDVELA